MLHEDWKFDPNKPDQSVYIRFGTLSLGNWKWNCVEMEALELVRYV